MYSFALVINFKWTSKWTHCKATVVLIPTLSSLVAPEIFVMTKTESTVLLFHDANYLATHGWSWKCSLWKPRVPPVTTKIASWKLLIFDVLIDSFTSDLYQTDKVTYQNCGNLWQAVLTPAAYIMPSHCVPSSAASQQAVALLDSGLFSCTRGSWTWMCVYWC